MLAAILSGCGGGGGGSSGGGGDGGGGGGTSASCSLPAGSNSVFCGTVTGLPSGQSTIVGVQTSDAGSNQVTVTAGGSFTITLENPLTVISTWNVYVRQQPTGTTCLVTNGGTQLTDGGVKTTTVSGIVITCSPAVYYTVGGSLTGLNSGGQITLQDFDFVDDVTDHVTLTANGTFTFPTSLRGSVAGYSVTVPNQPPHLTCTVTNGSGYPITANVTNVSVTCSTAPYYTVGGTLTGLGSGGQIGLQNYDSVDDITDHLTLTTNGIFTFATSLRGGSAGYNVTVDAQPAGQQCAVSNGAAVPITANVTNVSVACTDSIGGTLTGLDSGAQITLLDSGGDPLVLTANGAFVFPTFVANGGAYAVTVGTHPVGEMCSVTGGSGNASGPIAGVQVACMNVEQVLYNFTGVGGAHPDASLIMNSSGDLFGTTFGGGTAGTAFELAPNGSGGYGESVLHDFTAGTDGQGPEAGLIMDGSGNLYGTTSGGQGYYSTVFELAPNGSGGYTESVLHLFSGAGDGDFPRAGLVTDGAGDLYGTTDLGGTWGVGVVYELSPNGSGGYNESILYNFGSGSSDGGHPDGGLILDSSGDLYGTASSGGSGADGTVFELTPNGSGGYNESTLHPFAGGSDGAYPGGALILDSAGNLYGTTPRGGSSDDGTVFKLAPNGSGAYTESILYSFAGGTDGAEPNGGLIMDTAGNLYGTTAGGGNGSSTSNGYGTVFKLAPNGSGGYTESILYSFIGSTDGTLPDAGLIMDSAGNLYGTTDGASSSDGNVFEIYPQ